MRAAPVIHDHRGHACAPTSPDAHARSGLRPNFDFVPRAVGRAGITIVALDAGAAKSPLCRVDCGDGRGHRLSVKRAATLGLDVGLSVRDKL
jgi:hypothetical protein